MTTHPPTKKRKLDHDDDDSKHVDHAGQSDALFTRILDCKFSDILPINPSTDQLVALNNKLSALQKETYQLMMSTIDFTHDDSWKLLNDSTTCVMAKAYDRDEEGPGHGYPWWKSESLWEVGPKKTKIKFLYHADGSQDYEGPDEVSFGSMWTAEGISKGDEVKDFNLELHLDAIRKFAQKAGLKGIGGDKCTLERFMWELSRICIESGGITLKETGFGFKSREGIFGYRGEEKVILEKLRKLAGVDESVETEKCKK